MFSLTPQSERSWPGVQGRPIGPDASPAEGAGGRAGRGGQRVPEGPCFPAGVQQEGPGHPVQAHIKHHRRAPLQEKGRPASGYGGPGGFFHGLVIKVIRTLVSGYSCGKYSYIYHQMAL